MTHSMRKLLQFVTNSFLHIAKTIVVTDLQYSSLQGEDRNSARINECKNFLVRVFHVHFFSFYCDEKEKKRTQRKENNAFSTQASSVFTEFGNRINVIAGGVNKDPQSHKKTSETQSLCDPVGVNMASQFVFKPTPSVKKSMR